MAVLTARTRVVSFRVSEEEYRGLLALCLTWQARSISELARLVTLSQSERSTADDKSESTLHQIRGQLGAIHRDVKMLAGLLEPQRSTSSETGEFFEALGESPRSGNLVDRSE
jgi:hypothetical protein